MVLLLRIVFLVLAHTLQSVESAKPVASSLNLGDATLLVIDGLADEGMKLAHEQLANEGTNVNLMVEMDDGARGTPLAVAIASMALPKSENCMDLVHALLAHKDIDVNAALTVKDGTTVPPLVLAAKAVNAGMPIGAEIAKALLEKEQIDVNAMSGGGTAKLAPLHMALASAARGLTGGLELARALIERSDTDVEVEMAPAVTPLLKLATLLKEQPTNAHLPAAIALLHGRAKPLADAEMQALVESAVARKDEL